MKTVAIIQARMLSTRLPGKVMLPIAGKPMLQHVVERVQQSQLIDQVAIASSDHAADQPIWDWCESNDVPVTRGDQFDVLSRYRTTAVETSADYVVRITSDCPLIDPDVIDETIQVMKEDSRLDYVSNFIPNRSYPRGLDTEVITRQCLEHVSQYAKTPAYREHVTLMIYRNAGRFSIRGHGNRQDFSAFRWTVDTPEDFRLICAIYDYFGDQSFRWKDVLNAYRFNPAWHSINHLILQKAA